MSQFDHLDADLLHSIMLSLPLEGRLLCSTAVCKAWRGLCTAPVLWERLELGEREKYRWMRRHAAEHTAPLRISKVGLQRLLKLIPAAAVKHVSFENDTMRADMINPFLKALPSLAELDLDGEKITPTVLNSAGAAAPKLSGLRLGPGITADNTARERLLSKASRLQRLWAVLVSDHTGPLSTGVSFPALCRSLRDARGGCSPLLTHLTLSDYCGGLLEWRDFHGIGQILPDLTELRLGGLDVGDGLIDGRPPTPMQPLPRLQHLHINRLIRYKPGKHLSQGAADLALGALLPCAPNLETLFLRHGTGAYRELPSGWPALGKRVLSGLPSTLRGLSLQDFVLEPAAFDDCALPRLEHLRLSHCGPYILTTAKQLLSTCKHLAATRVLLNLATPPLSYGESEAMEGHVDKKDISMALYRKYPLVQHLYCEPASMSLYD